MSLFDRMLAYAPMLVCSIFCAAFAALQFMNPVDNGFGFFVFTFFPLVFSGIFLFVYIRECRKKYNN